MNNKLYYITARSESSDYYAPILYKKKPTKKDQKHFIENYTNEEINQGGPGDFGSYVYLTIDEAEIIEN